VNKSDKTGLPTPDPGVPPPAYSAEAERLCTRLRPSRRLLLHAGRTALRRMRLQPRRSIRGPKPKRVVEDD
jgi:hypothetical protein